MPRPKRGMPETDFFVALTRFSGQVNAGSAGATNIM
jgi:hypothetical protein